MKANNLRIKAIAFGVALFFISAPRHTIAGDADGSAAKESPAKARGEPAGGAKSAPTPPAAPTKHTSATPQNNPTGDAGAGGGLTGSELTGSELTGSELTGSELTGSQLTGSELTGSQLTGFSVGFGNPPLTHWPIPFLAPDLSNIERNHKPSPPDAGRSPNPPREATAPVANTASPSPPYISTDAQLQSAQTNYDAALTRIRAHLSENPTYQQAIIHQNENTSPPTALSSVQSGNVDAALTVARMESSAVAADPQANAAKQKLDEAVLARNNAERAKPRPKQPQTPRNP